MSVGACAVVDIGLWKYFKAFSGHSARQYPTRITCYLPHYALWPQGSK